MPRHKAKLQEKKGLGDAQLVFLGDSITHALENKEKSLWKENYAPYTALNLGYAGELT
ncbi:MAG: hypothetical protein ABGY95_08280 [Rubritalea sp.]|uniref:hypothetical protein n=1 Tax=Rubritalea sp. TaxID=2109375 RepID=UPI003241FE7A